MKYDGGVVIAADTLGSYGSLARFTEIQRVIKVNETTIVGAGGDFADFQFLSDIIKQKQIDEECADDGFNLKPKVFGLAANTMCVTPCPCPGSALLVDPRALQPAVQVRSPVERDPGGGDAGRRAIPRLRQPPGHRLHRRRHGHRHGDRLDKAAGAVEDGEEVLHPVAVGHPPDHVDHDVREPRGEDRP